jgi:hypothetical protein
MASYKIRFALTNDLYSIQLQMWIHKNTILGLQKTGFDDPLRSRLDWSQCPRESWLPHHALSVQLRRKWNANAKLFG